MRSQSSVISSNYNIVWLAYTVHYIFLFSILGSGFFDEKTTQYVLTSLLPLNIIMNSISIILAVIGVIISHQTYKKRSKKWNTLNMLIHLLMIIWIFSGSLWILLLIY